jgi:hypothetical protein
LDHAFGNPRGLLNVSFRFLALLYATHCEDNGRGAHARKVSGSILSKARVATGDNDCFPGQ